MKFPGFGELEGFTISQCNGKVKASSWPLKNSQSWLVRTWLPGDGSWCKNPRKVNSLPAPGEIFADKASFSSVDSVNHCCTSLQEGRLKGVSVRYMPTTFVVEEAQGGIGASWVAPEHLHNWRFIP